jgi:hypothetical protein
MNRRPTGWSGRARGSGSPTAARSTYAGPARAAFAGCGWTGLTCTSSTGRSSEPMLDLCDQEMLVFIPWAQSSRQGPSPR